MRSTLHNPAAVALIVALIFLALAVLSNMTPAVPLDIKMENVPTGTDLWTASYPGSHDKSATVPGTMVPSTVVLTTTTTTER